jgi:hypothetical protein
VIPNESAADLKAAILAVIARGAAAPLPDAEFNDIALRVFGFQFEHNHPYRAYCQARGRTPNTVGTWIDVPAVPTDAFRAAPLVTGGSEQAIATFLTSGTTGGTERRGAHHFPDLAIYDAAARAGFAEHVLAGESAALILSLIPPPRDQPDSSLSHMMGTVMDSFGVPGSDYYVSRDGGLDRELLSIALHESQSSGNRVVLAGSSFAFVHLFDDMATHGERFRLPPGSRAMDTGGFKVRSREVSRPELVLLFSDLLGIRTEMVINEYGMTEMSSQMYGRSDQPHFPPGWVRSRATDPETLEPVPDGELGILRHWDIANLYSVLAIQTSDMGRVLPGGVELQGRAPGATPRGCSMAMDDLLSALSTRG